MHSRRKFIKRIGIASAMATSLPGIVNSKTTAVKDNRSLKKIRIGIIGAENNRTLSFARIFNIDKLFPGVEVNYVWGETQELANRAQIKGQIPNSVKNYTDMLGKIDALIVDHRHPKYHLEAARPFVEAGIPTFIEKPFCYRVEKGKDFLKWAREIGTPVCSYSSIAHTEETFDIKKQVEEMGEIRNIVRFGPADFDSEYGGFYYYGVHLLQPLMYIFREDIEKVQVTRNGSYGIVSLAFANGLTATLVLKSISKGWNTFIETQNGIVELHSRVKQPHAGIKYSDMVSMFRTGQLPRSHESILKCVATLEAIEKSSNSESWEYVSGI